MNKLFILTSLSAFIFFTSCKSKKEEKTETAKYSVTSPLVMDTSVTKEYVAQIQSLQNIEVRAQVKGYLQSINVDEGQYVNAGQTMFKIMPNEYAANTEKAEAEVKAAEVELLNAKTLADKDIVSKSEQKMAQAKLDQAKAELASAQLFLSFTNVKAPFSGIIDRIRFKKGSLVDDGTLLTSLSNNKEVYAYFNVSEVEYLNYKNSNKKDKEVVALILANGEEHKHKGIIENIEGEFDNETGNIAFRAKFPNPDNLLRNGETGKVKLVVQIKNAIIIPQKTTYEIQDKLFVFVVDKNNTVQSRQITISGSLPDVFVVSGGLSADDKILLEGVQKVKDNDKINIEYQKPEEVLSHLLLKSE